MSDPANTDFAREIKILRLLISIEHKDFDTAQIILNELGIPTDLTLKERIAYFHLLESSSDE